MKPFVTVTMLFFPCLPGTGRDGLRWHAYKDDTAFLKPQIDGRLMRNPNRSWRQNV